MSKLKSEPLADKGTLFVCATPIGNLGDVTLRVLDTLRRVDLIAAEDTRHSRKLLEFYDIHTPMVSYHEHNEKVRAQEILRRLEQGENIALISDAGMPGISDPGQEVIALCQAAGLAVDVLPGPNAALTALVLSGLPTASFAFHGFLPVNAAARRRRLTELAKLPMTQIFYEAPHRLVETLADAAEIFGERDMCVVRELTKLHQSVRRGPARQLLGEFRARPPKGECCLLTAPYVAALPSGGPAVWREEVKRGIEVGLTPQEAMKKVAAKYGIGKRDVYRAVLEEKAAGEEKKT